MVLRLLAWLACRWIHHQRRRHLPSARALHDHERQTLEGYFDPDLLASVRICEVERVSRPWFIRPLAWLGVSLDMDFRSAAGITFGDLVLISDLGKGHDVPAALLFHELVHVLQYRALGIEGFAQTYVQGWLRNGRAYMAIPLEQEAYALEGRFRTEEHFRATTLWQTTEPVEG